MREVGSARQQRATVKARPARVVWRVKVWGSEGGAAAEALTFTIPRCASRPLSLSARQRLPKQVSAGGKRRRHAL